MRATIQDRMCAAHRGTTTLRVHRQFWVCLLACFELGVAPACQGPGAQPKVARPVVPGSAPDAAQPSRPTPPATGGAASPGGAQPAPGSHPQSASASPPAQTTRNDAEQLHPPLADAPKELALLQGLTSPATALALTSKVTGTLGVVASVEAQATRAGIDVLSAGGNAVDAAVATAFALAVTHPSAGNLGGGGFLLLRHQSGVFALDFRENAPQGLTTRAFLDMMKKEAKTGAAVGVPGTVAGLLAVHERFGHLPLAEVLAGAESLARGGYLQGQWQASTVAWAKADLLRSRPARRRFFKGEIPLGPGSRIFRPDLALALQRIRESGRAGFYEGATAADILTSLGPDGLLTQEDLKSYRAEWRDPLSLAFRGFRVVTMPPPSGGGVVLTQTLAMFSSLDTKDLAAADGRHLFIEVSRRAQTERLLFVRSPELENAEAERELRGRWLSPSTWLAPFPISMERATKSADLRAGASAPEPESPETTHLSTSDSEGNVVSLTVTLSGSFGTRIFTQETGIALNNSVGSFNLIGANRPVAGARTVSSMSPTLLLAAPGTIALGSPGGDTIPSSIAQLVLDLTAGQSDLDALVREPRLHPSLLTDAVETERDHQLNYQLEAALRSRGHRLKPTRRGQGDAHLAAFWGGQLFAASDVREGGLALGAPLAAQPITSE